MKKYSISITIMAQGLQAYILIGQPAPDKSSSAPASSAYSAAAYAPSVTVKPTTRPITYTTTTKSTSSSKPSTNTYILNKSSKKFHKPTCSSVKQMKESNKRTYTGTRSQVIEMGYSPCGRCNP
jgi:hypothetical protein